MIWKTTPFIITLCLAGNLSAQSLATTIDEASFVISRLTVGEVEYTKAYVREHYGRSVFNPLFRAYKHIVSDQDNNSCSFHPSCSNYTIESIKRKGFLRGVLNGFDRLSRCHGMAPEYYTIDEETRKLDDSVQVD